MKSKSILITLIIAFSGVLSLNALATPKAGTEMESGEIYDGDETIFERISEQYRQQMDKGNLDVPPKTPIHDSTFKPGKITNQSGKDQLKELEESGDF